MVSENRARTGDDLASNWCPYLRAVKKGMYVHVRKVRKSQFCGTLSIKQILLQFALGEPMFVEDTNYEAGRLLQDVRMGGRVHLDVSPPDATGRGSHFLTGEVTAIEGDVVVIGQGFYRVTSVTPPAGSADLPSHLRALEQGLSREGMINLYSRAGYPLWMNLIVSRFPMIFLKPNPHIFDTSNPIVTSIDPRDRVNLRYGFECREGWAGLIEEIAGAATALVKVLHESGLQPDAYVHSAIIKAKLGSLRWDGHNNLKEPFRTLFNSHVAAIYHRSFHVCEICGKYGQQRVINGWKEALCDEDYARRIQPRRSAQDRRND